MAVTGVSLDYTTWLNIAFLLVAAILVIRFLRTGGMPMLRMMNGPADGHDHQGHDHHGHDHHGHDHKGHDHQTAATTAAGHMADQARSGVRLDTSRNR